MTHTSVAASVLACMTFTASALGAQSAPPHLGSIAPAEQGFGRSLALADGQILIGEPLNRTEGIVYVYGRDGDGRWIETGRLRAAAPEAGDRFGRALAARGGTLVVGATSRDSSRGAAFVFDRGDDGTWRRVATLTVPDPTPGDALGRSAAFAGDMALVGAAGHTEQRGTVFVFGRNAEGRWSERGTITAAGGTSGDLFGLTVAADAEWAAVTALGQDEFRGAVYLFRYDATAGTWHEEARLQADSLPRGAQFGSALALRGDRLLVGAPNADGRRGTVFAYEREADGWQPAGRLSPPDTTARQSFGGALALEDGVAWIGAPGAQGGSGVVHRFVAVGETWRHAETVRGMDVETGDQFGTTVVAGADLLVVGLGGDDFGLGSAMVLERTTGGWDATKVFSEFDTPDPVVGGEVSCSDGEAAGFPCENVDIVAFLPLEDIGGVRGVRLNDVWGWRDPETGKEYALVGRLDGTSFIDVSDPQNPRYLGNLPKTEESPPTTWRDIKVYANHAFIVSDGAGPHGMQVFDLTQLRDVRDPPVEFSETAHYDRVHSVHNIVIDTATATAFAVGTSSGGETCGGGLHMIDISEPTEPTFAGCFAHPNTGRQGTGYTHDAQCVIYEGPDTEYRDKEICFNSNETALSIADVTDKANPKPIASASYPNVGYAHQGWLSEDHRYFYMDDELDEMNGLVPGTRTLIWDVSDLDDPILVKEYIADFNSTDHNLYVRGNYVYQTNNTAGLRILDVSDPENPVEVAYFDPVPFGGNTPGFDGTWSSYPFFESGIVVVSSRREGVFILRARPQRPIP